MTVKVIQQTDELRSQFVSLLGSLIQGGSIVNMNDSKTVSELFHGRGGLYIKRNPSPMEVSYFPKIQTTNI